MGPFLNWFSQLASISRFGLMTLHERKGSIAASIFGTAGVVAVLVGVLSIAQGFRYAMTNTADPCVAVVLRSGADSEMMSILFKDETRIIADAPGVARSDMGPLSSPELFVVLNLPKRSTGTDANVPIRGVLPAAYKVRKDMQLVSGRWCEPGRNEIVVGRAAVAEFSGLELGGKLKVGQEWWSIVGVFSSSGGIDESEIWTDAGMLQSAYRRGMSYQIVYVRLTSPEAFSAFKETLSKDIRLNLKIVTQTEFYAGQSSMLYKLITGLGTLIAMLMGAGAVFGALNTMYTAVATRAREMATLRALGFGKGAVILSVMVESMAISLLGGFTGGTLAYYAFDGYQAATMNWQSFSQVAFAFRVTPGLLVQGVVCASLIGLVGGLFPAIRAARMPIARALREG